MTQADAHPLSGVLSAHFSAAKRWWGIGLFSQILASLAGAISVLVEHSSLEFALVIGVVSALASAAVWRSEHLRGQGESLLRHVELEDAFGWRVEPKILADALAEAIPRARQAAARAREQGSFFSSSAAVGGKRAVDNLQESAWWSQHTARFMGQVTTVTGVVLTIICLWSLLVAAAALKAANPLALSSILTAVIALVFCGNLVRLPIEYFSFSRTVRGFDDKATQLTRAGTLTDHEALRMLTDYQLERTRAPLLPDWAWRLRRKRLNEIWATRRSTLGTR